MGTWRTRAQNYLARIVATLPIDADEAACRKAFRARNPYKSTDGHPYKIWRSVVNHYLSARFPPQGGEVTGGMFDE